MDKILGIVNLHTESNFGNLTQRKNIETTLLSTTSAIHT